MRGFLKVFTINEHGRGGVAQWLGRRISDQGVPGSNPDRCAFVVALGKSHIPPA